MRSDSSDSMFQWSHDFSVMDSVTRESRGSQDMTCFNGADHLSVMDRIRSTMKYYRLDLGFNGATTFQSWIADEGRIWRECFHDVSMEPRLFSHG